MSANTAKLAAFTVTTVVLPNKLRVTNSFFQQ